MSKYVVYPIGAMVCLVTLAVVAWALQETKEETRLKANQSESSNPPRANRLIQESSPYLLQHAHNPVDWYPWGEEAFQKARDDRRPVFLSIGYSTCHWCHVMEEESFSHPEIAAFLNEHFVSIKVDREERPDIDTVYMTFVQSTTGQGGWPMSVFLTPDLEPFFGGTYFPPETAGGRTGFKQILEMIVQQWKQDPDRILASAQSVTASLKQWAERNDPSGPDLQVQLLDSSFQEFSSVYDERHGGFGQAPKFPRPAVFNFLLRYHRRAGNDRALEMVRHTLVQMARGGIHDHLGGGFHRYSTDGQWFLPHFEKMLYDQAQLTVAYLETLQASGEPFLSEVAKQVLDYVLREMTAPEGGFYSAEDADSVPFQAEGSEEKTEGAFYVWQQADIQEHLDAPIARIFSDYYGVREGGNVSTDPFGEFRSQNVLHAERSLQDFAEAVGSSEGRVQEALSQARSALFKVRSRRPRPLRDDKILTGWNGLMISAFAKGFQIVGDTRYLAAAQESAGFLAREVYDSNTKTLLRRYRKGQAGINGFVEDYAYFVQGLLDLYESDLDSQWLTLAIELTDLMVDRFWDEENGGFLNSTNEDRSVLFRVRDAYDGAEPSANSIAALNLLRLSQIKARAGWRKIAEQTLQVFQHRMAQSPQIAPQMMVALDFFLGKPRQILIAGDRNGADTQALLRQVHQRFLPVKTVLLADGGPLHQSLARRLSVLNNLDRIQGKATAYICEDYVCQLPTNDPEIMGRLLDGKPARAKPVEGV